MTDLDLPANDVIGVWYVPPSRRHHPQDADMACVAGKNMTLLLRRFVELHEAVVAIEEGAGFRPIDLAAEEVPPFLRRVHLRVSPITPRTVAPSIYELREALAKTAEHAGMLTGMLDELAASRSKERLRADTRDPADTSDLPPDGATGLYLDRPFDVDDLEWIKMAWDAFLSRGDVGGPNRASQLMLVFQAITRDSRSAAEFLRAMNTMVLPLCRRLRLKAQPNLARLGAAIE